MAPWTYDLNLMKIGTQGHVKCDYKSPRGFKRTNLIGLNETMNICPWVDIS